MPKCCYCGGRGWAWRGIASNAERVPCEPCGGEGRWRRVNVDRLVGVLLVLTSAFIVFGVIHFSVLFAYGQSAGALTLKDFRVLPQSTRIMLVAGAMAATEHAGLRCPDPQRTVAEYVSALTFRRLDDTQPWVGHYFRMADEQGCRVEDEEPLSPKEGA